MQTTLHIEGTQGIFTAYTDNHIPAGTMQFNLQDNNIMAITHTIVKPQHEGQGVGKALLNAGIQYAQANHYRILPICTFAQAYIQRKPELHALLAQP